MNFHQMPLMASLKIPKRNQFTFKLFLGKLELRVIVNN